MNISDIISDALVYPFNNIKALVLYAVLGIVAGLIGGVAVVGIFGAFRTTGLNSFAFDVVGIVGLIVFILVLFLIEGYALDIVKYAIERRDDTPEIDMGRQIANAAKLIVVNVVYYIIPIIIIFVLGLFLRNWILTIISIILLILFTLANYMAKCRLAKTDDISEALAIGEAIEDISRVGLGKILGTVIVIAVFLFIVFFIIALISNVNNTIGSILLGIFSVYYVFFYNRAVGLMYSDT